MVINCNCNIISCKIVVTFGCYIALVITRCCGYIGVTRTSVSVESVNVAMAFGADAREENLRGPEKRAQAVLHAA